MNKKRGFNLIEIAIVLAVIGLVIGGIYIAASAVTDNNRRQAMEKQILQIISNIRTAYAGQGAFTDLTADQARALAIYPPDMLEQADGQVTNTFGGVTHLYAGSATGWTDQEAYLSYYNVPTAACGNVLPKLFGSGDTNRNLGIVAIGVHPTFLAQSQVEAGVTPAEAASLCIGQSPFGAQGSNEVVIIFHIH